MNEFALYANISPARFGERLDAKRSLPSLTDKVTSPNHASAYLPATADGSSVAPPDAAAFATSAATLSVIAFASAKDFWREAERSATQSRPALPKYPSSI